MTFRSPTLSVMLSRTTIEDHDEILKACDATLKESKGDFKAQFVKVIALIKEDRYADALRVLEDGGDQIKVRARLEHAYVLYKIGRQEEARQLVHGLNNNRGAKHLEAQAAYRSEDFEQAARLYKELAGVRSGFGDEDNDLRIQVGATDAQLEWKRQGDQVQSKKASRQDLEAFETAYNAACGSIARGELAQAEFLLNRAKDLCEISDDLTGEDKVAELLPIQVQQLYVNTLLGKHELTETLRQEGFLKKISETTTKQIAQANISAGLAKPGNPYLVNRFFKAIPTLDKNDSLFQFQADVISYNKMALELEMSKFNGVANRTAKLIGNSPATLSSKQGNISIANAAAHAENQLGKLGLKSILPLLERRPSDVGLIITIIHLYVLTRNHGSAITVLESFLKRLDESVIESDQDVRCAPGLIALLVALYSVEGRNSQVKRELAKATSYWRCKSQRPPALLHAAGESLLATTDLQEAREIFHELYDRNQHDRIALAGLVASNAIIKAQEVTTLAEQLTPITKLTSHVDIDGLEQTGILRIGAVSRVELGKKRLGDDLTSQRRRRVRRSRLPDLIDPSQKPDPERWLPLRDRSTYRPKGKRGKQKVATLTQGGQAEKSNEGSIITTPDASTRSTSSVLGGIPKAGKKKRPKK